MSHEGLSRRRSRFSDRMGLDTWSVLLTFFNVIGAAVAAVMKPVNLSNDELLVLICLAHAGDTLSMGEIERSSFFQSARVRRAVDRMETRRLVAWCRSRMDRRKVLVRMTKAGRRLTDRLSPVMFELVREVAEPVGQEATEFMQAKMRRMLSSAGPEAAAVLDDTYAKHRYDRPLPPAPDAAGTPTVRLPQRPPTWGLAGWLCCCQWSSHVDRLWRREFRNQDLTAPRLQVLAVLSGTKEAMTVQAVASPSATGLPHTVVKSALSALERAGLVAAFRDEARSGTRQLMLTAQGEQRVVEALPMANRFAEALFRSLNDEDLARVLLLLPKLCSSASLAGHHCSATTGSTSTATAQ
jgi:DNA-binding MarR family transcriptional regulator